MLLQKPSKGLRNLMLLQLGVATNCQFTQKNPTKNGEKVTNVHRHDSQHPASSLERWQLRVKWIRSTYSKYPTPAITVTYAARGKSTLSRQGVTVRIWFLTTRTRSSTPRSDLRIILCPSLCALIRSSSVGIPCTATYLRLSCRSNHRCSRTCFPAKSTRKVTAKMMRNIHVPA
jgi:hypothetical protein